MSKVEFREITKDTLGKILDLKVKDGQDKFVANNAVSIAQGHYSPEAWFRGIWAGDDPVGFVMLWADTKKPEYFLWRFMIAGDQQGKGYGYMAMELLIDHVKTLPEATEMALSYVPGEGCPQPFYAKLGFADTGEVEEGENIMKLKF